MNSVRSEVDRFNRPEGTSPAALRIVESLFSGGQPGVIRLKVRGYLRELSTNWKIDSTVACALNVPESW